MQPGLLKYKNKRSLINSNQKFLPQLIKKVNREVISLRSLAGFNQSQKYTPYLACVIMQNLPPLFTHIPKIERGLEIRRWVHSSGLMIVFQCALEWIGSWSTNTSILLVCVNVIVVVSTH